MIGLAFTVLAVALTSMGIALLLMLIGEMTNRWEDQFWHVARGFMAVAILCGIFLAVLTGLEATHVIGR